MAACAKAVQLPDGTLVLALDPVAQDLSTCAYVVEDGASNAWRELGSMSLDNAQHIGMSVGILWAGAYAVRIVIRALSLNDNESDK